MNETNEQLDTTPTSSTNKTGLFIGIIIVLLAIIVALGVYAYHLAHLPMENRSAPPPLHRLQQHPMLQLIFPRFSGHHLLKNHAAISNCIGD